MAIGFILESLHPGEASLVASGDEKRLETQLALIEYMEENILFDDLLKKFDLPSLPISEKGIFLFEDEELGLEYIETFINYSLSSILYRILTGEISVEEGYKILKIKTI